MHCYRSVSAVLLGIFLLSACSGATLQGVGKTESKSDKKETAPVENEDQTAVPPEVVSGAYLTCSPLDTASEELAAGTDTSTGELIGCMVVSRTEQTPIAVENYRTIWTIVTAAGAAVPFVPAKLNPGSVLGFAAILAKGHSAHSIKVTLGFPGSTIVVAQDSGKYGEVDGDAEMAPGSASGPESGSTPSEGGDATSDEPPPPAVVTPCVTENDSLKSQNGGCQFLPSGLVIGAINRDPSITSGTLSETQRKTMWYSEAVKICKNYRAGGFDNWRLPSREELEALQAADLKDKISFLQNTDGNTGSSSLLSLHSGTGSGLTSETKIGFWTTTKAGLSKYYACGIIDKSCSSLYTGMVQQFSFCVRSVP